MQALLRPLPRAREQAPALDEHLELADLVPGTACLALLPPQHDRESGVLRAGPRQRHAGRLDLLPESPQNAVIHGQERDLLPERRCQR